MQKSGTLLKYQDLATLLREIQITAGAIASYAETRSESLPLSVEWVGDRLDYLDLKLKAASEELNGGT
jgi:hypothetical protein